MILKLRIKFVKETVIFILEGYMRPFSAIPAQNQAKYNFVT